VCPLHRDSEKRIPLFATIPTGTPDAGEAADESGPVELLELVQLGAVHDAGDHLRTSYGLRTSAGMTPYSSDGSHAGSTGSRREISIRFRRFRLATARRARARRAVVDGVMSVTRRCGNGRPPPEILRAHHLAGGRLHQRRASEEDGPLPPDDDALVDMAGTYARRRCTTHHHRDLRIRSRT